MSNMLILKYGILDFFLRLIAAVIMLQTLYFKFTGAEESVYIFSSLGIEPWGRYFTGILELIASVLLFYSRFIWLGSILAVIIMIGAIIGHLTVLGIEVQDDGGYLFLLASVVLITSSIVLLFHKKDIPIINKLVI